MVCFLYSCAITFFFNFIADHRCMYALLFYIVLNIKSHDWVQRYAHNMSKWPYRDLVRILVFIYSRECVNVGVPL